MKKPEASFSIQYCQWLESPESKGIITGPFEAKDTRGKEYLDFSEVKQDQINRLLACKSKQGHAMRTVGNTGVPDICFYRESPAYLVVKFPKEFFIIDVETFDLERRRSKRKSLTRSRARDISIRSVVCK